MTKVKVGRNEKETISLANIKQNATDKDKWRVNWNMARVFTVLGGTEEAVTITDASFLVPDALDELTRRDQLGCLCGISRVIDFSGRFADQNQDILEYFGIDERQAAPLRPNAALSTIPHQNFRSFEEAKDWIIKNINVQLNVRKAMDGIGILNYNGGVPNRGTIEAVKVYLYSKYNLVEKICVTYEGSSPNCWTVT